MHPATTHELTFGEDVVTKTYRRWDHGEPRREWTALCVVNRHRPDLVPTPVEAFLDDRPPSVVMARLPGTHVGADGPPGPNCLDALVTAVSAFHLAVPAVELAELPTRHWDVATGLASVRDWALECAAGQGGWDAARELGVKPAGGSGGDVGLALEAGTAWVTTPETQALAAGPVSPVFARADGNVANLLWDGDRVRLVDFEDSGVSDLPFEVADLVEHLSSWNDAGIPSDLLLERFDLSRQEQGRLTQFRRLFGLFWLLMLLPGNPAHRRNPGGTLERQATRLLSLL